MLKLLKKFRVGSKYKLIKKAVSSILVVSILAPHLVAAATNSGNGRGEFQPPEEVIEFIDKVESGRLNEIPLRDSDLFHLTDQVIELHEGGQVRSYDLNRVNVEIPLTAFTSLKPAYDPAKRELSFNAFRGADKFGNNGVLVARHIIRNVDIRSFAADVEMIQYVDSMMRLHAIDLGFVATQVLRSPIPIFQNLWEPLPAVKAQLNSLIRGAEIRSGFLTRGTAPFDFSSAAIVPRNANGQVELAAGDFYVTATYPGRAEKGVLVFDRQNTYEQMVRGYKMLEWQAALFSSNTQVQLKVEEIARGMEASINNDEQELARKRVSDGARGVLAAINPEGLNAFRSRNTQIDKIKTDGARDRFTQPEWVSSFDEILRNSDAQNNEPAAKVAEMREKQWHNFIDKVSAASIDHDKPKKQTVLDRLAEIRSRVAGSKWTIPLAGLFISGTYFGFAYAYDMNEAIQQLKAASWAYEHLYPSVLKDAGYRNPLVASCYALAALWPEALIMSALIGRTFKQLADKFGDSTSKMAIYFKDLSHNWSGLEKWQRVASFGMRLYAWLMLPYWRLVIENLMQQKAYFTGLENNLNPLQKVLADSEIGRKLGLTEDQRLGLNAVSFSPLRMINPTNWQALGLEAKPEAVDAKLKLQNAVLEQNNKLDSIAMIVAATLVSEKYNMDPANVVMLNAENSAGKLDLRNVSKVLNTPERREEWQMLTHMIMGQMAALKKNSIVVDDKLEGLIASYYRQGAELAQKLEGMTDVQKSLLRFRMAFKSQVANKKRAFANFAMADHTFLRKVYTDKYVSDQVYQEFVIDHLMVIAIVGLVGQRADLSHPEHLAADPHGFLWTSNAHWYDMFLNTFSHFFLAGASNALVFQKVKPQEAKNYRPIEDYKYVSRERQQPLWREAVGYLEVFNLKKSDLGGIIIRRFFKRFTTIFAGVTMTLALRVGVFQQGVSNAFLAWGLNFVALQWAWGYVWDPILRGNQMIGERLEANLEKLTEARRLIARSESIEELNAGRAALLELYQKSNRPALKGVNFGALNREQLLTLSVDKPPIYTESNHLLTWITNWVGAVSSTYLAIPLSVILMDNKLLRASETWAFWIPVSIGAYTACYLLQKKYLDKYEQVWAKFKNSWKVKSESWSLRNKTRGVEKLTEHSTPRSCELAFTR